MSSLHTLVNVTNVSIILLLVFFSQLFSNFKSETNVTLQLFALCQAFGNNCVSKIEAKLLKSIILIGFSTVDLLLY